MGENSGKKRCPKGTRKNKNNECVPVLSKDSKKEPKHKTTKKFNSMTSPKTSSSSSIATTKSTVEKMQSFKTGGIVYLDSLTKKNLNDMIHTANVQFHAYTNNSTPPTLSDNEFDIVKEYLSSKFPQASALQEVGAPVLEKQKTDLPVPMPSMDKIKPETNALHDWMNKYKGPYVLSCKLDGVSGLYYTMNSKRELFTRGNGLVGQNISHLLSSIQIPKVTNIIVRGEFIVSKKVFGEKYSKKFANIRNMVAGLVNRKTNTAPSTDIDFVAYEVIHPPIKPSDQMKFLEANGFNTVQNITKTSLTNEFLSNTLIDWRTHYKYEIDGVIVSNDSVHERVNKNPDHAFAFKMVISDQVAETHVLDVIWTASKDGYLKPRVRISPVRIGGVKIEYATGFNAQFIESNKIGVGAVIQLVRSGDVIPYIKSVTTPADIAKMPSVAYSWNSTHVDILLINKEDDPVVLEKQITLFFTTLEVVGLSIGNVRRLKQAGYNSVPKIVHMSLQDFKQVEGFQEKLSQKIYSSIHDKITNSPLSKLLTACGCLGRGLGEKKIKPILQEYPSILTSSETSEEKLKMLLGINGIGKENAKSFVENMSKCVSFLTSCGLQDRLRAEINTSNNKKDEQCNTEKTPKVLSMDHPLVQKKMVFTGFREKEMMKTLEEKYQVTFSSSVSKNTFMVVTKDVNVKNTKVTQAQGLNIPIMGFQDFREKYFP
jgi:DNA ligase (NAD+)